MVKNYDLAKHMCEDSNSTSEELERHKREAVEKGDDLFLVLLLFSEQLKLDDEGRKSDPGYA